MALVSFKSLIDYALELNGMSINRLATTIGVDRPWLQHALVVRRNLGYDNFEKIMNSLTLSEQLNTELRETFAKEYFGEANFDIIKNCLKRLNTMSDFENIITPPRNFLAIRQIHYISSFRSCFTITKTLNYCLRTYTVLLLRN